MHKENPGRARFCGLGCAMILFSCVVIDETTGENHVPFLPGEILQLENDLLGAAGLN